MALSRRARARASRRRHKRMQAADNDLTALEWSMLRELWEDACAYCAAPGPGLQKDCVQPLSRGGRYTIENVVPACRSCNASKSNDEVTGWMRRTRRDERRFLERHVRALAIIRASAPTPDVQTSGAVREDDAARVGQTQSL